MNRLYDLLKSLPPPHRNALEWFHQHAGTQTYWPHSLADGTKLVSKAKGIYKPRWSKYALSIRQSLGGPYKDEEPVIHADRTWSYAYFQENTDPAARDTEYTNRGLVACWRDEVPVGVLRQVSEMPDVRYVILGIALVTGWENGYFYLEGFSSEGISHGLDFRAQTDVGFSASEQDQIELGAFDPRNVVDGRERTLASIVQRRGQPAFRKELLRLYKGCCSITGCNVEETLESVHIHPYMGADTNHPSNGLLLRSDLHTLFDIGLISIDPENYQILVSPRLMGSSYYDLKGKFINLPQEKAGRPSVEAIAWHRHWSGL